VFVRRETSILETDEDEEWDVKARSSRGMMKRCDFEPSAGDAAVDLEKRYSRVTTPRGRTDIPYDDTKHAAAGIGASVSIDRLDINSHPR
jgi:hypothetical protein